MLSFSTVQYELYFSFSSDLHTPLPFLALAVHHTYIPPPLHSSRYPVAAGPTVLQLALARVY